MRIIVKFVIFDKLKLLLLIICNCWLISVKPLLVFISKTMLPFNSL